MKKVENITLICANCQTTFERKPYRIRGKEGNQFCSHKCQIAYVTTNQFSHGYTDLSCANCEKNFSRKTSVVNGSKARGVLNFFCTRKCAYSFRIGKGKAEIVELLCFVCGNTFRRKASYQRSLRKGFKKTCCSRKCATAVAKAEVNKYAPFRFFLQSIMRNKRSKFVRLSVQNLIDQWEKQGGICPYSGVKMVLKTARHRGEKIPFQASLDRIDSSKGYIPENVEFVSAIANYAKNIWSRDAVLDFCERTYQHHAKR